MYSIEKLLEMLSSNKASDRHEACERLRLSKESSPEIVTALDKATHDEDKDIVERAILALSSDVHYHMAVKMGMIEPDTVPTLSKPWNGLVSFCISLFTIVLYIFLFKGDREWYSFLYFNHAVCGGILGFLVLPLLALIVGILGLKEKDRKKGFAIIGIALSVIAMLYAELMLFSFIIMY